MSTRTEAQQDADKEYRKNTKGILKVLRVNFRQDNADEKVRYAWLKAQGDMSACVKALIDAAMAQDGKN
jgi:hypothetical protein